MSKYRKVPQREAVLAYIVELDEYIDIYRVMDRLLKMTTTKKLIELAESFEDEKRVLSDYEPDVINDPNIEDIEL